MYMRYRIHRLVNLNKELKEVYANQLIESLANFIIGIFIPAYLISSGFSFQEVIAFIIIQWACHALMVPVSAGINARIGIKHTILVRAPITISYFVMISMAAGMPGLIYPAAIASGIGLSLYWTSMNTEYVRSSESKMEGEEAGILTGIPYITSIVGPVIGAAILTAFGYPVLFVIVMLIITVSVVPLFLSGDRKTDVRGLKDIRLFMDRKRAAWYFVMGAMLIADGLIWGLKIFLSYGILSLGIAASLTGLGMVFFTLIVGSRSNSAESRRWSVRTGGFLCVILFLMRAFASTQIEFILLSFAGGFIIMLSTVPIFVDFSIWAKKNGPSRAVAFREIWLQAGKLATLIPVLALFPLIGAEGYMMAYLVMAAALSGILMLFRE